MTHGSRRSRWRAADGAGALLTTGVDAVEIERIAEVLRRHGDRFLRRIYTAQEIAYCRGRVRELAARFAAKEALSKALGTGMRGIRWRELEVVPDHRGKPHVKLHGAAEHRAAELGIRELAVSLTHSETLAIASVVGIG